jgi:hypothetical protein
MTDGFEKLNDTDWGQWRMYMKALLVQKGLWEVVDGSTTLPAGSPNTKPVQAFCKKQAKALAEIILHVDVAQLSFIKDNDPKAVWEGLLGINQARGMASCLTLRSQFLHLQKGELVSSGPVALTAKNRNWTGPQPEKNRTAS